MWIDCQPRPAPEAGTPVKVLTVFKTCPDDDDEDEAKRVDNAKPTENIRSPRTSRHPAASVNKQSRRKADPPVEDVSPVSVSSVSVSVILPSTSKQLEEKLNANPLVSGACTAESIEPASVTSLTLEQLYSQCEQLAESLGQEVAAEDGRIERDGQGERDGRGRFVQDSSTDEASDDLSAALDVTSEQVSISCDSWRRVRHGDGDGDGDDDDSTVTEFKGSDTEDQRGRHTSRDAMHGRGGDYSPEYIEVEEPDEPVPTQDSCLQVTEEDIALSMSQIEAASNAIHDKSNMVHVCSLSSCCPDGHHGEHPLRALSQDNLTVISHFTGETYSQGTASEWQPIESSIGSSIFDPMPSAAVMDKAGFYQNQLEQLAKLHQQIYQQQSAAGNADGTLHPTPLSALTNCNIGSFKVLIFRSQNQ